MRLIVEKSKSEINYTIDIEKFRFPADHSKLDLLKSFALDMVYRGATNRNRHPAANNTKLKPALTLDLISALSHCYMPSDVQNYLLENENEQIRISDSDLLVPWELLILPQYKCGICENIQPLPICHKCKRFIGPAQYLLYNEGVVDNLGKCICGESIEHHINSFHCSKHENIIDPIYNMKLVYSDSMFLSTRNTIIHTPYKSITNPAAPSSYREPPALLHVALSYTKEDKTDLYSVSSEFANISEFKRKNNVFEYKHFINENAVLDNLAGIFDKDQYDIFYYSGHFVWNQDFPENSFFPLYTSQLYLKDLLEILGTKYPPRLVIINACNSAKTAVGEKGEKVGLPITFLSNGSNVFLGSLLEVFDPKGYKTITALIRLLFVENLPVSDALKKAKREILEDTISLLEKQNKIITGLEEAETGNHLNWAAYSLFYQKNLEEFWPVSLCTVIHLYMRTMTNDIIKKHVSVDKFDSEMYDTNPQFYIKRDLIEIPLNSFIQDNSRAVDKFGVNGKTGIGKTNLLCRLFWDNRYNEGYFFFLISDFEFSTGLDFIEYTQRKILEIPFIKENNLSFEQTLERLKVESQQHPLTFIYCIDRVDGSEDPRSVLTSINELHKTWDSYLACSSHRIKVKIVVTARDYTWKSFDNFIREPINKYYSNMNVSPVTSEIITNIVEFTEDEASALFAKISDNRTKWNELHHDVKILALNPYLLKLIANTKQLNRISVGKKDSRSIRNFIFDEYLKSKTSNKKYRSYHKILRKIASEMIRKKKSIVSEQVFPAFGPEAELSELMEAGILILEHHDYQFVFDLHAENYISEELESHCLEFSSEDKNPDFINYLIKKFLTDKNLQLDAIMQSSIERYMSYWLGESLLDKSVHESLTQKIIDSGTQLKTNQDYYYSIIDESLRLLGIENPRIAADTLNLLFKHDDRDVAYLNVAVNVLRIHRYRFKEITNENINDAAVLVPVLVNSLVASMNEINFPRKALFLKKAIHIVGSLEADPEGIHVIISILENLLQINEQTGPISSIARIMGIVDKPGNLKAISKIRFKQVSNRPALYATILKTMFCHPLIMAQIILNILRCFKKDDFQIRYLLHLKTMIRRSDIASRLRLFVDISEQTILLGFTLHHKREIRRSIINEFDTFVFSKFLPGLRQTMQQNDEANLKSLIEAIAGIFSYALLPHMTKYFVNSENMIRPDMPVSDNIDQHVRNMLPFLHPSNNLTNTDEHKLSLEYCFCHSNYFENYLGKTVLIVQGSRNTINIFNHLDTIYQNRETLHQKFLFSDLIESEIFPEGIPRSMKILRDLLSILVFILRRNAVYNQRKELEQLHERIHEISKLLITDHNNLKYITSIHLLSKNDLWHPFSALCISCALNNYNSIQLDDENILTYIINNKKLEFDTRINLTKRLLFELRPVSYFYPGICLRTIDDFIQYIILKNNKIFDQIENDLSETLAFINLTLPGTVSAIINKSRTNEEKIYYNRLREQISAKLSDDNYQRSIVNYFDSSLKTQGSHEAITTVFSEFDYLSDLILGILIKCVENNDSFNELLIQIMNNVLEEYRSSDYSIWNLIERKKVN